LAIATLGPAGWSYCRSASHMAFALAAVMPPAFREPI